MSKTKWTKGPWEYAEGRVQQAGNTSFWEAIRVGGVALATGHVAPDDVAHANSHLIAAAPEMYAALDRMVTQFGPLDWCDTEDSREAVELAIAALAKARGEHS